jgi:branched-chain amino acid transport system permease protein
MFLDLQTITGGAVGLSGVPAPSFFGFKFQTPFSYYYLALAFCAAVVVFANRLLSSGTGRAFDAINSNLRLAEASGVPTLRYQILAFTIGSALAALSGVLSAHYTKFVTPGSYETAFMVTLIVMVVLGGRGSVAGAVIGAAFIVPLTDVLRDTKEWENIIYGLIVLLTLRFVPDGLSSIPRRVRAFYARRRGPRSAP